MAGKTNDDLRILAAHLKAGSGGRGRRSPVYQWLFARADVFQRLLEDTQPSWRSVAEALTHLDIRDGTGKHPTAECVRQAWSAVKQARRAKPRPLQAAPPALPRALRSGADPLPIALVDSRDAAKAKMRAQFKPVTIRSKEQ